MDWVELRLADVCTKIGSGATPRGGSSVYLEDGPIAFVRSQNIYNEGFSKQGIIYLNEEIAKGLDNVQLEESDVLLNITGDSVARVCQVESEILPARVNQHVAIIRTDKNKLYPAYLRYFLVTPAMQAHMLALAAAGATRNALTKGMIESFVIKCPKRIEDQKTIADFLSSFDRKIALNRRLNQTLESIAQALFKSWFVDFSPVKAKIAAIEQGQDPLRAAIRAISGKTEGELDALPREHYDPLAETAALFPDEMEESELGSIPKGWRACKIGEFGKVICGKTPSKRNPDYFGNGVPFIKIPDMHDNMYVTKPSEQLTTLGVLSQSQKTIPPYSICVSCIATVGKVILTHEPSQTNQQINSIISNKTEHSYYLYFQMMERKRDFLNLSSSGSATLNMNTSTFSKIKVLHPNVDIISKFNKMVSPFFTSILQNQKQVDALAILRDTLLPKLLSSKLSLSEITTNKEVL